MGSAPGTLESESVDLTYLEQVLAGENWVPCPASGIVRLSPTPIKILLKLEFKAGKEWGGWGELAFATHHWGAREPGTDWVMPAPPPQILEIRKWSLAQQFKVCHGDFRMPAAKGPQEDKEALPLSLQFFHRSRGLGLCKECYLEYKIILHKVSGESQLAQRIEPRKNILLY